MTYDATTSTLMTRALGERGLINGEWTTAGDGSVFDVINPATGAIVGRVPDMGAAETRHAVESAAAAFSGWSSKPAKERADILMRWYALILEQVEEIAGILTAEQGKPLAEARVEVRYAAAFVRFYAEEAVRVEGEILPAPQRDTRILVLRQPVGVVGCIIPWNFPAAMVTRKAAPALAAGCTVVMKPAEATPLTALAIAALADEAGVPAGVLNIVTGSPRSIGEVLCAHPSVRKVSFTGSTATGRQINLQCAPHFKHVALELGGNAPFLVFEDADIDAAVKGALLSKFRHSGQTCVCTNRFLVHASVYDEFATRVAEAVRQLRVGSGTEEGVEIGPLINDAAVRKMESHVEDALQNGAKLLAGGRRHKLGFSFFEPTVLRDVPVDALMSREETFGPVAALMRFDTEDEAIRIANDSEFGLAGYFYSRDIGRAFRVAEKLECGMVGVNSGFLSIENAPFGGIKHSGFGREGSRHGLLEFLELKYLNIGGIV